MWELSVLSTSPLISNEVQSATYISVGSGQHPATPAVPHRGASTAMVLRLCAGGSPAQPTGQKPLSRLGSTE